MPLLCRPATKALAACFDSVWASISLRDSMPSCLKAWTLVRMDVCLARSVSTTGPTNAAPASASSESEERSQAVPKKSAISRGPTVRSLLAKLSMCWSVAKCSGGTSARAFARSVARCSGSASLQRRAKFLLRKSGWGSSAKKWWSRAATRWASSRDDTARVSSSSNCLVHSLIFSSSGGAFLNSSGVFDSEASRNAVASRTKRGTPSVPRWPIMTKGSPKVSFDPESFKRSWRSSSVRVPLKYSSVPSPTKTVMREAESSMYCTERSARSLTLAPFSPVAEVTISPASLPTLTRPLAVSSTSSAN
mmetsp:Transcript_9027/g.21139  ORF Transcript_9027/g.21139 Transcript_9027/m.21139 type:complete len:306 (-) Transcript_9027:477-1394(-)